ncbi:1-phosphofructokinase [Vibrio sp. THAF190c]|uniref:1-phosphofructokinase n=1 Tax=Vibrio sp. THAF190c TaxID=2587865 RepID=UPI0012A9513E|nr:1-phosphofructokinase [Vibrio sp. THAF190c]QFT13256.1 Tagatose-6-phosphate kinase [Vibrio sp. THAF190c]
MSPTKWVSVTLNPAVDLSAEAEHFSVNQVNIVKEQHRYAAGKGINVAKVMSDLGASVTLTGFLGCNNRELFDEMFDVSGLDAQFVSVDGTNRTNIKVHAVNGETTDINFNGFSVQASDIERLHGKLLELARDHDGFIFAGSLPDNMDENVVTSWIKDLKQLGKKIVLDSSKAMLKAGVAAHPWLIKPNETEVSELLSRDVESIEDGVTAAQELVELGVNNVLISMGEKGLIWATETDVLLSTPPSVKPVSTVGAGDSVVAAFCWANQFGNPHSQIATATAIGALAVTQVGVGVPSTNLLDEMLNQVIVQRYLTRMTHETKYEIK